LAAAALLVTLAVCACGGSSKRAGLDAICRSGALSAFAHDLGVDTASVSFGHSTGGNGMPQCTFSADAMDRHISALVNIDDGPQVEFRIERTLVEAQQLFGPPPPHWMPPIGLYRLGPYAAWYPVLQTLMATNGKDLLSITVTWPGAGRYVKVKLGRAVIGPYMKHGRKIPGNANVGYPSG
jgi:hypothetical protein